MPKLVLLSGTKVAAKFPITGEKTTLGREDDNDIVLEGSSVSRAHAQLLLEGEDFYVEDLGSRNGILLNSVRIQKEKLRDGDEILIGEYTFLFEDDIQTEEKGETLVASISELEKDSNASSIPETSDTIPEKQPIETLDEDEENGVTDIRDESEIEGLADDDATIVEDVSNISAKAVHENVSPARLVILKDSKVVKEHIINTELITIGRDPGNLLSLEDESVSSFHAQIIKEGSKFKLVDVESDDGTYFRGVKITQSSLRNGDEIGIGVYTIIFREERKIISQPIQSVAPEVTDPEINNYEDDDRTIVQSEFDESPNNFVQYPKFVMLSEPNPGQEFVLNKSVLKLGRDLSADIVIKDESISRLHALIKIEGDEVSVVDQDSLNGIEVDDEMISETFLNKGDIVKFGNVALRFVEKGEVYSIDQIEEEKTGVTDRKQLDEDTFEEHKKPKVPILRIALIGGIVFLLLLLILSFYFKSAPPSPTLSTYSPEGKTTSKKHHVSEISIYQLLTKGKEYLDYHKWEQAIVEFNKVLEVKPDHEEARIYREQAQTEKQNYETLKLAKRRYASGQEEDSLRILDQIPPSSVYYTSAKDQGDLARKSLIKKHLFAGKQFQKMKKYEKALEEYNKALAFDSKDVNTIKARKIVKKKLHYLSNKIASANEKTKFKSHSFHRMKKSPSAYIKNGINNYLNGDCAAALEQFQKVLKLGLPDSNRYVTKTLKYIRLVSQIKDYFNSGQKAFNNGNIDNAYRQWKKVLDLDQNIPKSRNSTYYNKIALPMAEKLYEKGLALYNAGRDNYNLKNAYSNWEKALQFNPNHGKVKEGLAKINEIASAVYREGYVRQDSDVNYAIDKWKLVLKIVPPSNEYNRKANKMISKYER